jgi:F-type H+-transporting ATPase subunit b
MKQPSNLILALGTALTLTFAAPALRAQEHAAPAHEAAAPHGEQPAHAEHEGAAAPGHEAATHEAATHEAATHEGATHEGAAHEGATHEGAAHEGAAHEGAHHPTITLFGHNLEAPAQFGVQLFNFIIFAAILVILLKGALAAAFKGRTKELEDKLSQAEKDKAEAAHQIQELDRRMAGLQEELEGIMAKAETDAEQEKERILESAKLEAAQILAQTQAEITFQKRQAEDELRALVASLAVEGATRRLETRLQGATAVQVLDRAIDQVGGAK